MVAKESTCNSICFHSFLSPPVKIFSYDGEKGNTHIQMKKSTSNAKAIESAYKDVDWGKVGGSKVEKGQYPWFARAIYKRSILCEGSFVASELILTAGTCVIADLLAFKIGSLNCGQKNQCRIQSLIITPLMDTMILR